LEQYLLVEINHLPSLGLCPRSRFQLGASFLGCDKFMNQAAHKHTKGAFVS
jgi:hypothetical protein